ncbi:TonB-dependent receptor [Edaphobacter paludis]|uniref:TonB-dependent receptor n=1 Tax=Edaphobacter paludis TaxID=3035702 RepID=A0AAU7D455_9BACT
MSVRKILICFTLLLLGLSTPAFSQAVNATLLGTVADPTGATVANAKITATEMKTGEVHKSVSNGSGNYTFPDLQPGIYSVTAEAPGFKKATHQNIDVQINSSTRVDLDLATGSVSETVFVTTAPPLLQTDRADISTKIEAHQVSDLPLSANRNFQSLLNLVPGTAPATYENSQFFNAAGSLQTRVNGMPRFGNLYQIEGIDDDNRTGLLQIIVPPAESIQSVDISTSNFEAELGRATGAVTNVILKSGSNAFHGSVFEFIQNSAVNARSYFGGPLGHLSYNYFGGSIGGPIWKDKLFFFGDYLRTIDHEAISNTFTIVPPTFYTPNAAGFIDLSAPLNTAKHAGQIYDPATGNPDGTGRKPFANNQIPFSRVNPVSLALLKLLPQPNRNQSNLAAPSNNYVTNLPFTKGSDSFDVKLDYTLNERNHLSGRYSFQHVPTFQAPAFGSFAGGPAGGGFQGTGLQNAYSSGLNYDHVFSPSLFTELRFGVAHLRNNAQPSDYGKNDATTVGIPGVNIGGQPFTSGQVGITLNGGFSNPTIGYSASMPWIRGEANIDFVNNWTKIIRNHTIKFGGDLRRVRDDLLQGETFSPRGQITFSAGQTSTDAPGAVPNVANDVASFLLDQPSQAGRDLTTIFPAYRQWWFFAFASDKWQATSKLTLDLGLRWEFYPPATPKVPGGFSNYDPTTNNLVLAGIGGNPLNVGMQTRYRYVAPRTGFAYRATDNTVIRGGFGISFSPLADDSYAFNYPVRANNSYQPNTAYTPAVLSNGQVATFQAGFPAPVPVVIPSSGIISASTPSLISQQYNVIPKNYKNAYVESWNVAVQQALPGNFSMQIAYVGNHGVDMGAQQNINLPSTYGGGTKFEPENIAFGRTASTNVIDQGFSSNYQSLQAQLNRRLSSGLSLTSAFTWGKGLDYVSGDDGGLTFFINPRRNYAPNSYDRTLNYEQSFTYALPFGRGRRWLNSGLTSLALGGWKVSGIISVVSGTPFTITADGSTLNTPGTTQTASLVDPYRVLHGIGQGKNWFDPTSFAQPAGCTVQPCTAANVGLGNTGRNQFRGPGYIQDNISLFKSFAIFRESSLETRIEAKQLSNTPQFANPNSTYSANPTSTFGQVTSTLSSGQGSVNGIGGGRSLQASAEITF